MSKFLRGLLISISIVSSGLGATRMWTNGGGDRAWSNAANWDSGLPGLLDTAAMGPTVPGPILQDVVEAAVFNMNVWANTDNLQAELATDAWAIFGYLKIGFNGPATFTINGGNLFVDTGNGNGNLDVGSYGGGSGKLIMNGGVLDVRWRLLVKDPGATGGEFYLYSGTAKAGCLEVNPGGFIDIHAGTLEFTGGSETQLTSWVDAAVADGRLKAYGGNGTIQRHFDTNAWKMVVTASPLGPPPGPAKVKWPSGLTSTPTDVNLQWQGNMTGSSFAVMFGDEPAEAAENATPIVSGLTVPYYRVSGLERGKVYYWRIRETDGVRTTTSGLFAFVTGDFELIEDGEQGDNASLGRVWNCNANVTASLGDDAHWGSKCLKLDYTSGNPNIPAELWQQFSAEENWSGTDCRVRMWIKGSSVNSGGPVYAAVEDGLGARSNPVSAAGVLNSNGWQAVEFPAVALSGVDLSRIRKIYLGVSGGGRGTVLLDDLRVYKSTCRAGAGSGPDINFDDNVNLSDMALLATDWMSAGEAGGQYAGDVNGDCYVDGGDIGAVADEWLAAGRTAVIDTAQVIGMSNGKVSIEFAKSSGALLNLKNLLTNDDYIKDKTGAGNPFRIHFNTTQKPPALLQSYPYQIQPVEGNLGGTLIDPKNCAVTATAFARTAGAGVLSITSVNNSAGLTFDMQITLGDGSDSPQMQLTIRNTGTASPKVMTAFPYFTGMGLGANRNTNLGVRLREFGQSRAPAWSLQGDLYGRGWDGQWNAVYEPSMDEAFGFIIEDPNLKGKIFHRASGGVMTVLYTDNNTLAPGASITLPRVSLAVSRGDWKAVALKYRKWFEANVKHRAVPAWLEDLQQYGSGWFPNPGDSSFLSFSQLASYHYIPNNYDVREWAMYWQCIVRMGKVDSYDHTDGIYDPRTDLGGMGAFKAGINGVVNVGRAVGLYMAGKTVRLDSPLLVGKNPQDWLLVDYAGRTIPAGALSFFACPGYTVWQEQLASQAKNLASQTKAKYFRLDELSFAFEPCYNPVHGHTDPYTGASTLALVKRVRERLDEVDPNIVLLTENPNELLSQYANGGLVIWSSGKDISPLRLTAPQYLGFSYNNGQVEAAINGFICQGNAPGNGGGWTSTHHEGIWGDGMEDKPVCYSYTSPNNTMYWDVISHMFPEVVFNANCASRNPEPMGFNSTEQENWAGRLWKTPSYWLMTCGSRIGLEPNAPVVVKIPELPGSVSRVWEFDAKTGKMKDAELVRTGAGIYCGLASGFSVLFMPMPDCPPMIRFDNTEMIHRGAANNISLEVFAPWRQDVSEITLSVKAPGLTVNSGQGTVTLPGTVSVSVPTSTLYDGLYYISLKGNCLPARKWLRVGP